MGLGILDTIGLMGTVILAAPVALFGLDMFVSGNRLVGGGFLAIAVLMVAAEEYVTKPTDVAADAAQDVASSVVETDEEE
ncbi:hypothetical protein BV210_10655 [Halorientalis sp. IM1011]|uniref:DUF7533 family protein n=1 Tax=Halorientalis sp. IM1011 TaxID=1932360 RepID=UPI00097CC8B3|nr:hypothetical protein [Halorientalis sp. IM1011]AQL43147.1 hypothetical protein BV210_10655 [Halorientalis sp. IM1011]